MSTDTHTSDDNDTDQTITLTGSAEHGWVARDDETGVASQGETRQEALANLDEALDLYHSDHEATHEEEHELLREIGLDPDEVEAAREDSDKLPEFMQ